MIDIWGVIWFVAAIIVFPFGYKPTFFLLCLSSIFQASKIITVGSTNIPLFFAMELFTILRLCLPFSSNGIIKINNKTTVFLVFLVFLIWFHAYVMTHFFEGLKVFSSATGSNEANVMSGGIPLQWGGANINQLTLLSVHLLTTVTLYCRRDVISGDFFIKSIMIASITYILISSIWFFFPALYNSISILILNNDTYSITAFFESRLAGTFTEPSLAGLYISSICIPFLVYGNIVQRLIGFLFLFLGFANISSTFVFSFITSFFVIFLFYNARIDKKIFISIGLILFLLVLYILFGDLLTSYIDNKSISDSGEVRNAVNRHSIQNIFNSYLIGIGLGSERPSSLFLIFLNNLGVPLSIYFIFTIFKVINTEINLNKNKLVISSLMIVFFGSFISIQEMTMPTLWLMIYGSILNNYNRYA